MTEEELQRKIDEFLERYKLTPTTFGLWAMNDSRFVFDLRNGRTCYGKTIRRIDRFMSEYEKKQTIREQLRSKEPA